jgi:hypothetical protein
MEFAFNSTSYCLLSLKNVYEFGGESHRKVGAICVPVLKQQFHEMAISLRKNNFDSYF